MEESDSTVLINPQSEEEFKLYTRRWFILALFVLTFFSSLTQMQQYVSITEIIEKYYDVSITEVNWSTLVYFLEVIFLIFPSIFIIEKWGLRKTILICVVGIATGAWIKVLGVTPNRFWVIILGQAVNGIFCAMLTILPAKVAAKWFGAKEVSLACGIGVLTSAVSLASGFLISTSAVNSKNLVTIQKSLFVVNLIYAVVPTVLIVLLYLWFDDSPPTPPSKAQLLIQNKINSSQSYGKSIKKFVTNSSFLCSTFIYNINTSIFYMITTSLNSIMIRYYPNSTSSIGFIGCIINIAGILGLLSTGIILDKFRQYKLTAWVSGVLCVLSSAAFIFLMKKGLYLAYFLAGLYGFFYYAVVLAVIEVAIELTYPEPEITVFGFFAIGAQTCAICFTYLCTYLLSNCSELTVNLVFTSIVIIGNAALIFIKYDLKRQAALTS